MSDTPARPMPRSLRLVRGLTVSVVATLLALALGEGVLRLARDGQRAFPYFPDSVRKVYPSEEITPGVSGVSRFSTNSHGCRGPEYAGQEVTLLTIGGSTTACSVLDDEEEWPHLLMRELNARRPGPDRVWVTNSGMDGKNSHHHVMHARHLLPRLPPIDHVLVYAGLNDVGMWLYKEDFDPHFLDDPANAARRRGEAFRLSSLPSAGEPWFKNLELWKRASVIKDHFLTRRALAESKPGRIVQDAELRWMEEQRARRQEREKGFVPRAKMETLPAALDSWARSLRMIVEAVRAQASEPVFVAQAIQHQFLDEADKQRLWMGAMDGGARYVEEEQMLTLVGRFNDRMREVAEAEGVLYVDLPTLLQADGAPDLFYDGVHFNEKGCRVVAHVLADALEGVVLDP